VVRTLEVIKMPTVNINLRINDISNIVEQLDIREKILLIQKLEEETWSKRFDQLHGRIRRRVKQYPINEQEIIHEVEQTRKQRYDQSCP